MSPTRPTLRSAPPPPASRRFDLPIVIVILALSIAAWVHTLRLKRPMDAMVMGLGQIGFLPHGDMGAALFLAMWATMMAAMMLPSAAPMVLAHRAITRGRGESAFPTLAFVTGYLVVWSISGVLPFLAYLGFARFGDGVAHARTLRVLSGAIFVVAGAYQLTAWKEACLGRCQSPFAFLATHDFRGGARSGFRAGVVHGAYCLGCCWALMAVLLVVGLMNLAWMAALFWLVFVEKAWRHGLWVGRIAGVALIALGAIVFVHRGVLEWISR